MEIRIGRWFTLPRLGTETFSMLVRRAQLEYDKSKGFKITDSTDLHRLKSILSTALNETINFTVKCYICEEDAGCTACEFESVCDRNIISRACLCAECIGKSEPFTLYSMRFAEISMNR